MAGKKRNTANSTKQEADGSLDEKAIDTELGDRTESTESELEDAKDLNETGNTQGSSDKDGEASPTDGKSPVNMTEDTHARDEKENTGGSLEEVKSALEGSMDEDPASCDDSETKANAESTSDTEETVCLTENDSDKEADALNEMNDREVRSEVSADAGVEESSCEENSESASEIENKTKTEADLSPGQEKESAAILVQGSGETESAKDEKSVFSAENKLKTESDVSAEEDEVQTADSSLKECGSACEAQNAAADEIQHTAGDHKEPVDTADREGETVSYNRVPADEKYDNDTSLCDKKTVFLSEPDLREIQEPEPFPEKYPDFQPPDAEIGSWYDLYSYFCNVEQIPMSVIKKLTNDQVLYQASNSSSIVYYSKDTKFAQVSGTNPHRPYFRIISGSSPDGYWGFASHADREAECAYICESAIDAISLYVLHRYQLAYAGRLLEHATDEKKEKYYTTNIILLSRPAVYASICGINNYRRADAVCRDMGARPVYLCTATPNASQRLYNHCSLSRVYPMLQRLEPKGRNWHEYLIARMGSWKKMGITFTMPGEKTA